MRLLGVFGWTGLGAGKGRGKGAKKKGEKKRRPVREIDWRVSLARQAGSE